MAKKMRDLVGTIKSGDVYGRLTVVESLGGKQRCICSCEKKTEKIVDNYSLADGTTASCGCLVEERKAKSHAATRVCPMCKIEKPRTPEFWYTSKSEVSGLDNQCKVCKLAYANDWNRRNSAQLSERSKKARSERKQTDWAKHLFLTAKHNAKTSGREYTIDEQFIEEQFARQGGRCFYTGTLLEITSKKKHPLYPSLDRQDSALGYTPENVVIVAWWVNMGKAENPVSVFLECLDRIDRANAPINKPVAA